MNFNKLAYNKTASDKSDRIIPRLSLVPEASKQTGFEETEGSATYRKTEGVLSTSLVLVLSGGEKRERDFLRELVDCRAIRSLRVLFISEEHQGMLPDQMQERFEDIQKLGQFKVKGQNYMLDTIDKVFLLSDLDEFREQLIKIIQGNKPGSAQWIISNPCFEIWLYYCYLNDPEDDLAELKTLATADRSKRLKALGNELVPGGLNPRLSFEKMKPGIEHSLEHYGVDADNIPVLYATQMHMMAQYIIDTLNQEYPRFLEEKEKERRLWKSKLKG